ncbi:MAG: hypothetical protein HKM28_05770, partial [Flavobacteriaceae bacterium]|nr:hypothetical protein [Flavobacteriaceae bacterium]
SCDSIAYPVGNQDAFNDIVIEQVRKTGYRLAFAYTPGINYIPTLDQFALKRVHVDYYMNNAFFAAQLQFPNLFIDR